MTDSTKSLIEEIIAVLWSILWAIFYVNEAHTILLWVCGFKAISDHITAIYYAYRAHFKPTAH